MSTAGMAGFLPITSLFAGLHILVRRRDFLRDVNVIC